MKLSIIAAVAGNGVIGRQGRMPWHLPMDLARFRKLTMGHHLLMGRRTFQSIGRPLDGRTTVVISRGLASPPPGVLVARSLKAAVQLAAADPQPFVAGGGLIYAQALPLADALYLTQVDWQGEGDTFFPHRDPDEWVLVAREEHPADGKNRYACSFEIFQRRRPASRGS
ncbi:MAG: dihydrofolate reductase [Acidobacteriota bacterium]